VSELRRLLGPLRRVVLPVVAAHGARCPSHPSVKDRRGRTGRGGRAQMPNETTRFMCTAMDYTVLFHSRCVSCMCCVLCVVSVAARPRRHAEEEERGRKGAAWAIRDRGSGKRGDRHGQIERKRDKHARDSSPCGGLFVALLRVCLSVGWLLAHGGGRCAHQTRVPTSPHTDLREEEEEECVPVRWRRAMWWWA
jgi:hypothetical protein